MCLSDDSLLLLATVLLTVYMPDPTYDVIPIFRHDVTFYTISKIALLVLATSTCSAAVATFADNACVDSRPTVDGIVAHMLAAAFSHIRCSY